MRISTLQACVPLATLSAALTAGKLARLRSGLLHAPLQAHLLLLPWQTPALCTKAMWPFSSCALPAMTCAVQQAAARAGSKMGRQAPAAV